MSEFRGQSGLAAIDGARIYNEVAGEGRPLVMIHAGVADRRQWDHEFAHFARRFRVLRYNMRGYGKSEPVEGACSQSGVRNLQAAAHGLLLTARLVLGSALVACSPGRRSGHARQFA
jgi:pimeloyl-ACP methyl ester carboxylesterase